MAAHVSGLLQKFGQGKIAVAELALENIIGTSVSQVNTGSLYLVDSRLKVREFNLHIEGRTLLEDLINAVLWFGVNKEGELFDNKLDCAIGDITGQQELMLHPEMEMYNDNQLQWYSYLRGDLTDETRIDSPYIAMQTAFLSEGVMMSGNLGRSVTADEIKANAKSIALREQETPFGTIKYDFDDYKAD